MPRTPLTIKSLHNKGFWMVKGSGHNSDRETSFDNSSKIELKRPRQWFVDAAEVDFLPNKKQAIEDANEKSSLAISNANFTPWENCPNFHQVSNIGPLFGSETRPITFTENNSYVSAADDSNVRSKMIVNQFGNDTFFGLSISQSIEDSEPCMNFGGIKKVRVNQVKDSDVQAPAGHNVDRQSIGDLHEAYNREVETTSASTGKALDKDGNLTLMGLPYSRGDAHVRTFGAPFGKGDNAVISVSESYNKEDANIISFGGFPGERDIISVGRASADYEQLYNQSSVHVSTVHEKELDSSNSDAVASAPRATTESETLSKNKEDTKTSKKDGPYCFPSNVRSLISTGMLDGVPVKYVSVAREELRGIIRGSGYLCGCQSCNYSKALNAYEFERHAGCKSKHPNNHIYFENGKTIYQIVQELKSTPESLLFDTIQTICGAPINQKAFRNWKESFQAATRELQRIYGKEGFKL